MDSFKEINFDYNICSQTEYEKNTGEKISNKKDTTKIKHGSELFDLEVRKSTDKKDKVTCRQIIKTADIDTRNVFINTAQNEYKEKVKNEEKRISNTDINFPYLRQTLMTDAEIQLYNFMNNNLNQLEKIVIMPKVRLADIVKVDDKVTLDKQYLWNITNKHVDFVICDRLSFDTICVVELDDYTHENKEAKEKDLFIMQVLRAAGISTARIRIKISTIEKSDLQYVNELINTYLAPSCPSCGLKMIPRRSKDGHAFYACADNQNCRKTINIEPKGEELP